MLTCPQCGTSLEFDDASQKMICPSCGSIFDPDTTLPGPEELGTENKAALRVAGRHLKKEDPGAPSFGPKRFLGVSLLVSVLAFLLLSLFFPPKPALSLILASALLLLGTWICSRLMRVWTKDRIRSDPFLRASLRRIRQPAFILTSAALLISAAVLLFAPEDSSLFYLVSMLDAVVLFLRFAVTFRFRLLHSGLQGSPSVRGGGAENV